MRSRTHDLAAELRAVIRCAGRDSEALEGRLPVLSSLHQVATAGELDEAGACTSSCTGSSPILALDQEDRLAAAREPVAATAVSAAPPAALIADPALSPLAPLLWTRAEQEHQRRLTAIRGGVFSVSNREEMLDLLLTMTQAARHSIHAVDRTDLERRSRRRRSRRRRGRRARRCRRRRRSSPWPAFRSARRRPGCGYRAQGTSTESSCGASRATTYSAASDSDGFSSRCVSRGGT